MKTSIKINVHPFEVPNVVSECTPAPVAPAPGGFRPASEFIGARRFHLSELPVETLESLCTAFTEEVFLRAGKARAPTSEEGKRVYVGDDICGD